MNEKRRRIIIFLFTAFLHLALIFFIAFETKIIYQQPSEHAKVMKVTDLAERPLAPPPPPPPPLSESEIPQVEDIAEIMIETDEVPIQEIIDTGSTENISFDHYAIENYLPVHMVSHRPEFNENEIISALVYPPIAQRSGIEGRVILELFVDRSGIVQIITVLLEDPEGRGFGEAAVRAFTGRKGTPAYANGEAVSCRYRYPVSFRIR
ncbi:MAG: energy transducer TonB [Treponema sp.]|nr:energy transducer TonB [Treponema sp.]